jgi:hypothetical protein
MPILTDEEYDALVALALEGATTEERKREISSFVGFIDEANDIVRRTLWVQWQETDTPLPAGIRFPETWPPEMRKKIERRDRDIGREDVKKVLEQYAVRPINVMVTNDIGGILGWTLLADYFRNP